MTPTLLDLALKAGFSDPIEGWMGEAYEERLEAFAKLIIEHEAAKRKPLTNEKVYALANKHLHYQTEEYEVSGIYSLARAIEAAHGITGEQA